MAGLFASLTGLPVVRLALTIPFTGIWHADVSLDRAIDLSGPQVLTLSDFVGACSVVRAVDFTGARSVRLVGGTGGWRSIVPPLQYQNPGGVLLSAILGDVAATVGEIPPVVGPTVSPVAGPAFVRQGGAASLVLQDLFGASWWMDQTGTIQATPRLPTAILAPVDVLQVRGSSGIYRVASVGDILAPWVPGALFASVTMTAPATVNRVCHVLEDGALRTEIMVA
jgi:hypothetical protein